MKKHIRTILPAAGCLALWLAPEQPAAQTIVEARLDTASILVGEQVQLVVRVKTETGRRVVFPVYPAEAEITPGVEVVTNGRVDTTLHNAGKRMELERKYTVTSFDSALYDIKPYAVIDRDTVRSRNSVGLKVGTVNVDTTHVDQFRGPHDVVDSPFRWTARLLLVALGLCLVAALLLCIIVRLSDKKPVTRLVKVMPPVAPHKQAMAEIERVKALPKNSREEAKEYYMRLTDALRTYIQDRFGLNAREMTTTEIIDRLLHTGDPTALRELREVLEMADLVKFAKYESSLSESDRSVMQAIDFVNTTKPDESQQAQPRVEVKTLGDTKQRALRRALWVALAVLAVGGTALCAYLIWDIASTFL